MTGLDLAVLRTVAEAATPGPWYLPYGAEWQVWHGASEAEVRRACVGLDHGTMTEVDAEEIFERTGTLAHGDFERAEDAAFIAAANPVVLLALLDRLAAVEALHVRKYAGHGPDGGDTRGAYCDHCSNLLNDYVNWPCDTRLALDSSASGADIGSAVGPESAADPDGRPRPRPDAEVSS